METETKTLTFSSDNLTTSSCGKSEWSTYDNLENTDCAPDTDKGNLGKQDIGSPAASLWAWGHTLVKRVASIGNLGIRTSRSTMDGEESGGLEQGVTIHRVVAITQQRVRKGESYCHREIIITLDGGDTVTLSLFGTEVADVTLNAKFTVNGVGHLKAKECIIETYHEKLARTSKEVK